MRELHHALGIPPNYAAERRLIPQPEVAAADLVDVGLSPHGRMVQLHRAAAAAWQRMQSAAAHAGPVLVPISGFRAIARQAEIIREKLAAGQKIDDILRLVAAPGFSEHHTGRALDIGSPDHIELEEDFAQTAAFRWLESHATEFGFHLSYPRHNAHGIAYEPWHWLWRG